MSRPAEPERKNPHVGESNPAQSLWDEEKPYTALRSQVSRAKAAR